ncbi:MAG TPA: COX15/CtaA family protein [Methylomirabilota bacterium]|nr:COX15/CtaA family protein [Methylomirabilota bacterium]
MRAAHRLALLTGAATLLLILVGGLVTNTGSALAVPDWPTTFGHNMFLYPWSQMVGGVFYEHSHRLLGSLVGLLTLALAAALWRVGSSLRVAGLVAAIVVIGQGVLGGLRVVLLQDTLAILHGCLAQAFFALVAALALATSSRGQLPVTPLEPGVRTATLLAAGLVYVQIVFGALLTHAGWLQVHLVGALAVFALVPVAAARLHRSGDAVAAPLARSLLVMLALQLVLGLATLAARLAPEVLPASALLLGLPVAHRLAGSLILALSVMLALRVWSSVWHVPTLGEAAETTA